MRDKELAIFEINTPRLIIRDHCEGDLESLYSLFGDERVTYYVPDLHCYNIEDARANLEVSIKAISGTSRKEYFYALELKDTREYIGEIGFTIIHSNDIGRVAEMGYFIKPFYWGKGYAVEGAKALIDYAFSSLNVIKFILGCLKENSVSEAVMIKLGFKKEGTLVGHQYHRGEWKDRVIYGLNRN